MVLGLVRSMWSQSALVSYVFLFLHVYINLDHLHPSDLLFPASLPQTYLAIFSQPNFFFKIMHMDCALSVFDPRSVITVDLA